MDGREHEVDRKNKHCRKLEEHHSTDGFGEYKGFSAEVYDVWDT